MYIHHSLEERKEIIRFAVSFFIFLFSSTVLQPYGKDKRWFIFEAIVTIEKVVPESTRTLVYQFHFVVIDVAYFCFHSHVFCYFVSTLQRCFYDVVGVHLIVVTCFYYS